MVFNDFLEAHETSLGLNLHVLSLQHFANGFRFYEARRRSPVNASALVAVSHVWARRMLILLLCIDL